MQANMKALIVGSTCTCTRVDYKPRSEGMLMISVRLSVDISPYVFL
jgi:hypothetical protein